LSQTPEGELLKSVGFEDGDVIRSVNGKEIRSLEDAIAFISSSVKRTPIP